MPEGKPVAALWFAFRGNALLVYEEGPVRVPEAESLDELDLAPYPYKPLGSLDGRPCYVVDLDPDAEPPTGGTVFRDLRSLFATIDAGLFRVAGRAIQILEFDRTHQFCGRCSARTVQGPDELSKRCTRCGTVYHPRLSPASIVLVRRDEELLLARSPGFPKGMYSVLAGFVEPGESIEETIGREILEEVGVEVRNVRYFGSQPWPFPHSLMIGFTAEYAGGEIEPQADEIEDAGWYPVDALPDLPPRVSIARAMIDAFVAEHARDGGKPE